MSHHIPPKRFNWQPSPTKQVRTDQLVVDRKMTIDESRNCKVAMALAIGKDFNSEAEIVATITLLQATLATLQQLQNLHQ